MPTYDYVCENGHEFDVFQSMKDEPLTTCVRCDAKARRRIGPGAGFIFKGGGFYSTEYRSKEYQQKAKAESGAAPASGETAKPAADATSKPAGDAASKPAPGAAGTKGDKGSGGTDSGSQGKG